MDQEELELDNLYDLNATFRKISEREELPNFLFKYNGNTYLIQVLGPDPSGNPNAVHIEVLGLQKPAEALPLVKDQLTLLEIESTVDVYKDWLAPITMPFVALSHEEYASHQYMLLTKASLLDADKWLPLMKTKMPVVSKGPNKTA